jgi:serine/threonine-protein kinase
MGSVHYLPPEQASGKGCTIKSDIYSMGIIFYELLSGSLPFRGDNAVEIALKHMREPLPSLRDSNNAIPQSIENIIRKSTAKNPKNRYDSARSMHEDLLTALNDERMDEEVYQYKYPENESEAKKTSKAKEVDSKDDKEEKEVKTDKQKEEIIADLKEDDFTDSNKKDKSSIITIVIIIILSLIFLGFIGVLLFNIFVVPEKENKEPVRVPDCEGLKVSQCEKKLHDKGFEIETKIEVVESDTIEKNLIVKTEPGAGRSIKYGSKITLYKSAGEVVCVLEDYTGQNSIQVQTLLNTKYGIIVKIEKKEIDEENKDKEYDEDEIIGQNLAQGSEVKKGEEFIIYIPDIKTKYPDFIAEKWSLSDIQSFCDNYGLKLETEEVSVAPSAGYSDGEIMETNKAKGSDIIKGTTLRVKVAKVVKVTPSPSPSPSASPSPEPSSSPSTE